MIFSGCASTITNLQRETARFIGDIHPDEVSVYNINRGITDVRWEVDTPKGKYSCSADDMVRRVYCAVLLEREMPKGRGDKKYTSQGTGFVLYDLPIVVSNYHIVDEVKEVELIFQDGIIIQGKVIKRDKKNDLAIITFEDIRSKPICFHIFPSYKVETGQEIYVIGYPLQVVLGENPSITKGMISSTVGLDGDSRHFRITAQLNPGNSGGPLLDVQGRVIGVISHTLNKLYFAKVTGHIPEGTNFAIKSDVILNLYPGIKNLINEEETLPLSAEKIFSTYSKAVVLIKSYK